MANWNADGLNCENWDENVSSDHTSLSVLIISGIAGPALQNKNGKEGKDRQWYYVYACENRDNDLTRIVLNMLGQFTYYFEDI